MELIRLMGVGGNLKTSLLNRPEFREYLPIPEHNRELGNLMSKFNGYPNVTTNFCSKYLLIKEILKHGDKFIMDRSLYDYVIIDHVVKNIIPYYKGTYSHMDKYEKEAIELEDELFKDFKCHNILLVTKEINQIRKMIDEGDDERANFYDNTACYLEAQDYYEAKMRSRFKDDLLVIYLQDWSDIPMSIDQTVVKIQEYISKNK